MTIAYDGTNYSGWQIQPRAISIQATLEDALRTFLRQDLHLIGAGRTDAGVHALGQVAHFSSQQEINTFRFMTSVNSLLPNEIRVLSIEKVSQEFHAQYSAVGKIYHYFLTVGENRDPFSRDYRFHLPYNVDLQLLHEAAQLVVGKHDFCAFANVSSEGVASYDSIRNIKRIELVCEGGSKMHLEFEGDGFLYKMVRNLVGTFLEVATKKRSLSDISEILLSRDRRRAGKTAPAHGLFLMQVLY